MAMRNDSTRSRSVRPLAEDLEGRQLLAGVVSGVDVDGDRWTLRLTGPGAIRVTNQNNVALGQPGLIREIEVAGSNPLQTRVIGTVQKSANGDGKVFFSNFTELSNHTPQVSTTSSAGFLGNGTELITNNRPLNGSGLLAISMPNFWLGDTAPATASTAGTPKASISIPDGVQTLNFGGADTTAFFGTTNSQRLNQNGVADTFQITLGLPAYGSTHIIINKSITDAQAAASSTASATQDSVSFTVFGRLDLFQANAIEGNSTIPSTQFNGGTRVESIQDQPTTVTGAIGNVRVGGNATNFSVSTNDRLANYYIGGETNNLYLLTPSGSRNISFGLGADNVNINSAQIQFFSANRGAINANVISSERIGRLTIGGDVVDSQFQAGYVQGLASAQSNQTSVSTVTAQVDGYIQAHIAGNVTNSVFAASVQPDSTGTFGNTDLNLTRGQILAKVEGHIDNSSVTPNTPTTAFYAKTVKFSSGPVVPPNNPSQPFTKRPLAVPGLHLPGQGGRYKAPIPTHHKNIKPFANAILPNTATPANPVVTTPRSGKAK